MSSSPKHRGGSCCFWCRQWTRGAPRMRGSSHESKLEIKGRQASDKSRKEVRKKMGSRGSSKDGLLWDCPSSGDGLKPGGLWKKGILLLKQACVAQSIEVLEKFKLSKKFCSELVDNKRKRVKSSEILQNEKDEGKRMEKGSSNASVKWNTTRKNMDEYIEFDVSEGKLVGRKKQGKEGFECLEAKPNAINILTPFCLDPSLSDLDNSHSCQVATPPGLHNEEPLPELSVYALAFEGCAKELVDLPADSQQWCDHTHSSMQSGSMFSESSSSLAIKTMDQTTSCSPQSCHVARRLENAFEKCKLSLETGEAMGPSPLRDRACSPIEKSCLGVLEDPVRDDCKHLEAGELRDGYFLHGASGETLWFSLYLCPSEEVFMAKTAKPNVLEDKGNCEHVIRFFSCKSKDIPRAGWRNWLKYKQEDTIRALGEMEITSMFCSETDNGEKGEACVEFQAVLKSSQWKQYSFWDRISYDPALSFHKSRSLPGSPTHKLHGNDIKEESYNVDWNFLAEGKETSEKIQKSNLPFNYGKEYPNPALSVRSAENHHRRNLRKVAEKSDPRVCQKDELIAMVIRVPMKMQPSLDSGLLESIDDGGLLKLTAILPAGEHGCPVRGSAGPQPLIQRWRSGGKCDCGSWDLGCGLVLLDNQQFQHPYSSMESKLTHNDPDGLEMHVQGKKHMKALRLMHIKDKLFGLSFGEPLTALQAFAAAVAIFYGRLETTLLTTRMDILRDCKNKALHPAGVCLGMWEEPTFSFQERNILLPKRSH